MSNLQPPLVCLTAPSVCLAAITIFNRWKHVLAHVRQPITRGTSLSLRSGSLAVLAAALCFVTSTMAQETPTQSDRQSQVGSDHSSLPQGSPSITPADILGFEDLGTWSVSGFRPDIRIQTTTNRTQGSAAYEVYDDSPIFKLKSLPVAFSAAALTGIGNKGASLLLDVELPCDTRDERRGEHASCDADNFGWIEGFIHSRSRRLERVSLGKVSFNKYRPGIYNTFSFSIPDWVSSTLNNEDVSDLVFEFEVNSSCSPQSPYLFDNLRVHSVELVQNPTGQSPPAGYGGSVDMTVTGGAPVQQSFDLDPLQIPESLHLKSGTAGATTLQLEAGLDSATTFTCTYNPDASDTTNQSYKLQSCTGTYESGDLISSNWVSLQIVGGTASQTVYAQLVLSPLGDQAGSGLLPAMPTFWGSADSCAPAPVAGQVVTTSTSCATQIAQANTIITNYFNQVESAHPSPNWVVAPVPEFATRSADGTPTSFVSDATADGIVKSMANATPNATPNNTSNNVPFSTGGDLNPGGSFDAYWKLSGNLTPTAVTGTDENLTHFDAAFTAHAVLFGDDEDVVDAKLTADTDSGETTPTYKAATSSGTLGFYIFGEEIPSGGLSISPSTGFSVDPSFNQEYDLPPIQIWIFDITLGALIDADLNAQGSAAISGADLSVIPNASLGAHVAGGINLGIASGSVDAKVNLITLSTPMNAQVQWVLNNQPAICAATLNGSLNGQLSVSSGGGEVDLDASFGPCPFCYTDSMTLFKWGPLASKSWTLFSDTIDTQLFGLPAALCPYTTAVNIVSPTSGKVLLADIPVVLAGSAAPTNTSLPSTSVYTWTFAPGANASTYTLNPAGANSANPTVTFGPPTSGSSSTWTVNMSAVTTVNSAGGTAITETGTATPVTITVSNLSPGIYISGVSSFYNGNAGQDASGVYQVGNAPGQITITGLINETASTLNTTFTVVPCNDGTAACTSPGTATTLPTINPTTTTPSATWTGFSGGYFKVTMTTTSGATTLGTATAILYGTVIV